MKVENTKIVVVLHISYLVWGLLTYGVWVGKPSWPAMFVFS